MSVSIANRSRWPGFYSLSLLIHVFSAGLCLAPGHHWLIALGIIAANHAVAVAAGLWPRSRLLGPNIVTLGPTAQARRWVAITIDDGPDPEVTPLVLDVLDRYQVKVTFFCIGARARAEPALLRELVRRGHDIQNHSEHHRHDFSLLGPRAMRREVAAAQRTLQDLTGRAPRYFRAPAGLRNPFLEWALRRESLQLVSWTRRGFDAVSADAARVLARLVRRLGAGDILLLHDGHAARDASGQPVILAVLPALLERLSAAGLRPVTLHDALSGAGA